MKKIKLSIIILSFIMALSSCTPKISEAAKEKYTKTIVTAFDTSTTITGYDISEEAFMEKADILEAQLMEYHKLYDIYHSYEGISNIKTINDNAGIKPVAVSEKIIDMLEYGVDMYNLTSGKTNIAMGSVLKIWHDIREAAEDPSNTITLPTEKELSAAAEHIDIKSIVIDKAASTVYISDKDTRLDVGAVAKGYATDKLSETVMANKWTNIALSVGGNVKTIGTKADGGDWRIGIQNPDLTADTSYIKLVKLNDLSLVTSGSYQRYFELDGKRYHHIIDPATLFPENYFVSVSIICESSALGDMLSTALFNMTYEEGSSIINSLENTNALWVFTNGDIKYTKGLEALIIK